MVKQCDLFSKDFDADMAIALINLYALEHCGAGAAALIDMVRDIRENLCRYSGCSDADIADACDRFYNTDILSGKV